MDDATASLLLRLAVIRQRIDRHFFMIAELTAGASTGDFEPPIVVTEDTHEGWEGENVLIWHRRDGTDAWAVQQKCPHASISLQMADIEDFTASFPTTRGPCIACPAHMYVIDLGSGRCLTDTVTPTARTYAVHRTGPHTRDESAAFYCLWLAREPHGTAPNEAATLDVGNQIQLQLVAKGLRRRFGDLDDGFPDSEARVSA